MERPKVFLDCGKRRFPAWERSNSAITGLVSMAAKWAPDSWTQAEARQLPTYPDAAALDAATTTLESFPPLVFAGEARNLTAIWPRWSRARRSCSRAATAPKALPKHSANNIRDTFRVILQMAVVLTYRVEAAGRKLGRMAGQFAKPRVGGYRGSGRRRAARATAATSSTTSPSPPMAAHPTRSG